MINERLIMYLLTIAEEKSITAAAKKLFISQPALSKMLLELEHELGTDLFIRDRGHLQLSQAGEIYLNGCRRVLAVSDSVSKKLSDLSSGKTGQIVLGFTTFTAEAVLPKILLPFEKQYPFIKLLLVEERTPQLTEMVRNGKIDLAFLYQVNEAVLDTELVLEDQIYIQIPENFRKQLGISTYGISKIEFIPQLLENQSMVLLKEGRGMRTLANQFFYQQEIHPSRVIETENLHLANSLVCLNKGFTFVPGLAVDMLLPNSTYCRVMTRPYALKRKLYCCYRKQRYITMAEKYLIRLVSELGKA